MQKTKPSAFLLFMASLCGFSMAVYGNSFQNKDFSITLPDDWVPIPQEAIDSARETAKSTPGFLPQQIDCGYQQNPETFWFDCPFIIIQIMNYGPVSKETVKYLKRYKPTETAAESFKDFMLKTRPGRRIYDEQSNIFWVQLEGENDRGLVTVLQGTIPTRKGRILINCFSMPENFPDHIDMFRAAVASVSLNPGLSYDPMLVKEKNPLVWQIIVAGMLVCCLIAWYYKRKSVVS